MRKLLLIALLMASWVNAQSDIIRVDGVDYMVLIGAEENDPTISHVWGKDVPMRITHRTPTSIWVDTDIPGTVDNFRATFPSGVSRGPNEIPQLRVYVGGGSPTTVDANQGIVYIPIAPNAGHVTASWWWPNEGAPRYPRRIGREYHLERN